MEKIDTITINYYGQGITRTEIIKKENLDKRRSELFRQGYTCWTSKNFSQSNQQFRFA